MSEKESDEQIVEQQSSEKKDIDSRFFESPRDNRSLNERPNSNIASNNVSSSQYRQEYYTVSTDSRGCLQFQQSMDISSSNQFQ